MIWIDQIGQAVGAKDYDEKFAERDELGMANVERAAISQIELERSKTVARKLSEFIDFHRWSI